MNTKTFTIKHSILALMLLIFTQGVYAQKEGNNWYFGSNGAMTWNQTQTIVDGGKTLTDLPMPLAGGSAMNDQNEGVFNISDANGNLLFYSDGMTIWNREHQEMENGSGLFGHFSSAQSGIVIPYPGQSGKYIAFSVSVNYGGTGNRIAYSIVDMSLDNGLGAVVTSEKNVLLTGHNGYLGESASAVRHSNGVDFWFIAIGKGDGVNSALNVWKVTTDGVDPVCVGSHPLTANTRPTAGANGYLRFSVDGKYFAWPEYVNPSQIVHFGEFNPSNGTFPTRKHMNIGLGAYGAEFSLSTELLYLSKSSISVYKFAELLAAADPSSSVYSRTLAASNVHALQLGPDGRIYGVAGETTMTVIDNPDDFDNATIHNIDGLMAGRAQLGLPNFMPHIFASTFDIFICSGEKASINASLETPGQITAPEYKWYDASTGGNLLHTGPTFETTVPLTSDTVFYVSVEGDEYCEGLRLVVNVIVENCAELVDDYATILKNKSATIPVLNNDVLPPGCEPTTVPEIVSGPFSGVSATVVGKDIVYTPSANFTGYDSIKYKVSCVEITEIATVYITVVEYPDNIEDDDDCYIDPESFSFTLRSQAVLSGVSHPRNTPLVGDLDGDGIPEIVTFNSSSYTNLTQLHVHDGKTKALKAQITLPAAISVSTYMTTSSAVLVDADSNGMGEIIFVSPNNRIYKYEATLTDGVFGLTNVWGTGISYTHLGFGHRLPQPIVADFNGDGAPELVVYNQIFNAVTGAIIGRTEPDASAYTGMVSGLIFNGLDEYGATFATTADFDGDGLVELVAGGAVYKINIAPSGASMTSTVLSKNTSVGDGFTAIADLDLDGALDVVVANSKGGNATINVWRPDIAGGGAGTHKQYTVTSGANTASAIHSFPFIGDIDGEADAVTNKKYPEICLMTVNAITTLKYNPSTDSYFQFWKNVVSDGSGATGITLFDFNNDGSSELVYRDESLLRIIRGSDGHTLTSVPVYSGTVFEMPVVVDVDGDGSANILVSGATTTEGQNAPYLLHIFESDSEPWATARKVWNQIPYNVVNINENLTVPRFPLNPATVFAGKDGIFGTDDDVRPFNNFLQQQTTLNSKGVPFWPAPDAQADESTSTAIASGNNVIVNACFTNDGSAPIGSPVYVSVYKNSISTANKIAAGSANISVGAGASGCVSVTITDAGSMTDLSSIVVRINDRDGNFDYQTECIITNNVMSLLNPFALSKTARIIPNAAVNGTYSNPVSVLGNEIIEYTITAVNISASAANVVITDTLPAYIRYVDNTASPSTVTVTPTTTSPQRQVLEWDPISIPAGGSDSVSFHATPHSGVSASQPLFINYAWIDFDNRPKYSTNGTFHQGAGISIMTFSAGLGGEIFNATEQVLDYMSTPTAGIIIAPEEGYKFAGWSHDGYTSLRGVPIRAQRGIMHYDTLTVYGNVELHAEFVPVEALLKEEQEEAESKTSEENKVWVVESELLITTTKAGSIVRIYTIEGVLREQHTIVSAGTTSRKLPRGIYIVTINNDIGQKVRIE